MFNAKRFCCCFSLRMGCFIIAVITMLFSVACSKFILIFYNIKYPGKMKGSTADHTSLLLHLVPEIKILLSSLFLILYEMCPKTAFVILFVIINGIHIIYFIIISIVTIIMGTHIIVNYAGVLIHLYWPFCHLRIGTTLYFIYIVISYYKQRRKELQRAHHADGGKKGVCPNICVCNRSAHYLLLFNVYHNPLYGYKQHCEYWWILASSVLDFLLNKILNHLLFYIYCTIPPQSNQEKKRHLMLSTNHSRIALVTNGKGLIPMAILWSSQIFSNSNSNFQ